MAMQIENLNVSLVSRGILKHVHTDKILRDPKAHFVLATASGPPPKRPQVPLPRPSEPPLISS
jgi:hypothetical protein